MSCVLFFVILYVMLILDLGNFCFCFFKQKTAYEMRISDWSSDVCSSDLVADLSVVYPVARGTGPMLASVGAFLLLGEDISAPGVEIGRASCRERVCQYV